MQLANFVREVWSEGQITLENQLLPAGDEEDAEALALLKSYYHEEVLHMPGQAPDFDPAAALWATRYLLVAAQVTLRRDLDEEAVRARLLPYTGTKDAGAIFSADLMLRYLPDLLQLAKGLAPDDVLVVCLQQTLLTWPFSSVGMGIAGEIELSPILAHPSLRFAYRDKIIRLRDTNRMQHPAVRELIAAALGEYASDLWPEFQLMNQ
jgi:hypothetical protein